MRLVTLPNGARINPEHVVDVTINGFEKGVDVCMLTGVRHSVSAPTPQDGGWMKASLKLQDEVCSLIEGPSWTDQIKNGTVGVNLGMPDWTTTMVPATGSAVPRSAVTTAVEYPAWYPGTSPGTVQAMPAGSAITPGVDITITVPLSWAKAWADKTTFSHGLTQSDDDHAVAWACHWAVMKRDGNNPRPPWVQAEQVARDVVRPVQQWEALYANGHAITTADGRVYGWYDEAGVAHTVATGAVRGSVPRAVPENGTQVYSDGAPVVPNATDGSMLDAVLAVYQNALVVQDGAHWELRVWPGASTRGWDYTCVGWGVFRDDAVENAARIIEANQHAKKRMEISQRRQDHACKVCGNMPDADGNREHGKGCYVVDSDGGGSDFCDLETPR